MPTAAEVDRDSIPHNTDNHPPNRRRRVATAWSTRPRPVIFRSWQRSSNTGKPQFRQLHSLRAAPQFLTGVYRRAFQIAIGQCFAEMLFFHRGRMANRSALGMFLTVTVDRSCLRYSTPDAW